jgi:SAM-dependent methyltransferase
MCLIAPRSDRVVDGFTRRQPEEIMGSASVQGPLWGRHPEVWSTTMEQKVRPLYAATLDAVGSMDGRDLLDAGCGSGQALADAAARGATVSGVDASEPLLEVAQRRTPAADLRRGDIEALPFDGGIFDVVTAFNAIQYAVDPAAAVAELARVCRPGGQVAIGVWGDPRRCETESLFARLRTLAPPPPGTPAPLAVSEAGIVEGLLEKAGLTVEGGAEVPISFEFADLDEAWRAHTSAGPPQKVIDMAGEDAVREVIDAVVTADRKPDGTLRQDNVMRYVTARKPD